MWDKKLCFTRILFFFFLLFTGAHIYPHSFTWKFSHMKIMQIVFFMWNLCEICNSWVFTKWILVTEASRDMISLINNHLNMKYIPSNRHPKCWHCKYSLSLINPLRGVAHPSDRTWVHSVSSYKHRYRVLKQRVYQTKLLNWSRVLIHKERISSSIKTKIFFLWWIPSLPSFVANISCNIIFIFFLGGGIR